MMSHLAADSWVVWQFGGLYGSMLSSLLEGAGLRPTIAAAGKAVGFEVSSVARARDPMTA